MSYISAVDHLYALGHELTQATPFAPRRKFDLAHMRSLMAALGDPQTTFPSILIAGTNGKGSTAATLSSILTASGYRTGLYTSPHLIRVNERIQIDGVQIPDEDFARLYFQVDAAANRLVAEGALPHHPSFFEVLTALSFLYFAGKTDSRVPHSSQPYRDEWEMDNFPVDIAVLEVGLGGRLDATNIVDPLLSIITDIALDHQDYLGNTIAAITREKAGILRSGGTLITLPQHPEANQAIGEAAATLNLTAISAAPFIPPAMPSTSLPLLSSRSEAEGSAVGTTTKSTTSNHVTPTKARPVSSAIEHVISTEAQAGSPASAFRSLGCKRSGETPVFPPLEAPIPAAPPSRPTSPSAEAPPSPPASPSAEAPTARSIPAWGNAPGTNATEIKGLKARPILTSNRYTLILDNQPLEVDSPLHGQHQQRNIALAIAAAVALRNQNGYKLDQSSNQRSYEITNAAIEAGIRNTRWPGRLEFIPGTPPILLDVAHNPAGAWTLRAAIAQLPAGRSRTLIFSCLRDKSLKEMSQILLPLFDSTSGEPERARDHIILAPIDNPRAAALDDLLSAARALDIPAHAAPHMAAALSEARAVTPPDGLIIATGSIYLVGEIRNLALSPGASPA